MTSANHELLGPHCQTAAIISTSTHLPRHVTSTSLHPAMTRDTTSQLHWRTQPLPWRSV